MSAPVTRFPLTLTPLSPIHIGSGEELDWTRAILVQRKLVLFDPLRVELPRPALDDLARLGEAREDAGKALVELQCLFKRHERAFDHAAVARLDLTEAVDRKLAGARGTNVQRHQPGAGTVVNSLALSRHVHLAADGRPYVPGSSLKGALRTAEVAARDREKNPDRPQGVRTDAKDPSDELLGRFQHSLFARLMVSDLLPHGEVRALGAQVCNVRRRRKEGVTENRLCVSVELIPPFLPGSFRGEIRVAGSRGRGDKVATPDLAALMETTHDFHLGLFQFFREVLEKERRGLPEGWLSGVQQLLAQEPLARAIQERRAALVRLGKFCSAESKTVAWRSVRIPQANRPPAHVLHPYTLWLAELGKAGNLPLGWALLELADGPSQPVVAFCARFRPALEVPRDGEEEPSGAPAPPAPPSSPAGPRIVTDASPPNRDRLATLEKEADEGRDMLGLLENLAKRAKAWPADDRALLALLYHTKLRDRLKPYKQRELDQRLPKPD